MQNIPDVDPQGQVKVVLSDPGIERRPQVEALTHLKHGSQFQVQLEAKPVRLLIREDQSGAHIDVKRMIRVKMEQSGNGMVDVLSDDQLITRPDPHPVSHSQDAMEVRSESPRFLSGKIDHPCRCGQFMVPVVVIVSLWFFSVLGLQQV